jgi:cytochrome P450
MVEVNTDALVFPITRNAPLSPPPVYAVLREEPPRLIHVRSGQNVWLVTRHADVRELLADRRVSSDHVHPNFPRVLPVPPVPGILSFMRMDDPDHARLRRMLAQEFTVRRVDDMRPGIRSTADKLLDDMAAGPTPADLVSAFALPLPSLVICQLLGVPYADHDFFQERSRPLVSAVAGPEQGAAALADLGDYLDGLVASKERDPSKDLLGRMATKYVNTGELTHDELVGIARLLLVAGHETTANTLGLSMFTLLQHPDTLAELRQNPTLAKRAVDELLRFLTVIQGVARVALADLEIGGQHITKGDGLICGVLAANHDENVFRGAAELDIHRDARQHLTFGYGIHQCIGQALARVELEIAITRLLTRFPHLRLAAQPNELPFRTDMLVYGVYKLPIEW